MFKHEFREFVYKYCIKSQFFSMSFYQIVYKESQVFCNSVDVSASQK